MKSLSPRGMARYNRDLILDLLRRRGLLSRQEIRTALESSPATVNRLTTQLVARGLLSEDGFAASTGGRPSTLLRFNADVGYVVAIEVGPERLRGAIVNLCGGVVHRCSRPVAVDTPRERLVEVRELAVDLMSEKVDSQRILAVSVGVPGVVDEEGRVTWAPALGWHDVPLKQALGEVVDRPVHVENDANALAIAEYGYGAGRGTPSLVAIRLGAGVGAGIIVDGAIHRGVGYAAGEIGYMLASPDSLAGTYEGFGDLDGKVGADGIATRSRELSTHGQIVSADEVFARAGQGDAEYVELVGEIADDLALAVVNISVVLNPGTVVVGGDIAGASEYFVPLLRGKCQGRIPQVPDIVASATGADGVLIGVAEVAINSIDSLDEELSG